MLMSLPGAMGTASFVLQHHQAWEGAEGTQLHPLGGLAGVGKRGAEVRLE